MSQYDNSATGHLAAVVGFATEAEAYAYAVRIRTAVLYEIADLLSVEFPTDSPRKATVAKAVVREARA